MRQSHESHMEVTYKVICLWEVFSGVVSHLQGFIVTNKTVPVMAEIELLVVTAYENGQKYTWRQ